MVAQVQPKICGGTVGNAQSWLALREKSQASAMSVLNLRVPLVQNMKSCANSARKEEKTLGKRFCESKQETLRIGLRKKTGSGVALRAAVAHGGSKRLAINAVSPLVDASCL
jgi:hypothetical protein